MNLQQALEVGGDKLRSWLDWLWATSFNHGSALVISYATPTGARPGMTDNVAVADATLRALLEAGWIVCGKFSPTLEQRFFDVGKWLSNNGVYYASAYGYSPNYTCAEFRCYLGESDHGRGRIHHSQ